MFRNSVTDYPLNLLSCKLSLAFTGTAVAYISKSDKEDFKMEAWKEIYCYYGRYRRWVLTMSIVNN